MQFQFSSSKYSNSISFIKSMPAVVTNFPYILLFCCLLSKAFVAGTLPLETTVVSLRSDFKLQTAVLPVLCDIRSSPVVVFCRECVKRFPVTAFKLFFRFFVTTPVAPVITGIIIYFTFHIRCISINKPFIFLSCFLLRDIPFRLYCHIYQTACFPVGLFNYYIWPIYRNPSTCVYSLIP